ncbi:MAG: PilN domain-containing protein [Desulfamplus sp.]|nr:PilN domain-containing protein [Desulfamplus sp.]
MSEKILGLELSAGGLAAVVINRSFKKCTLVDACWIPCPIKDKDNDEAVCKWKWSAQSFDNAISTLISKCDLKGCSTSALCLPASLISFRTLQMPFASESKIRQILPFELASHLPMSHSGYISDFILVKGDISTSASISIANEIENISISDKNHIFTASLPVDVMDICFSVLKKHGFQPEIVTSQGIAAPICTAIATISPKDRKIADIGFEKRIDDADVFVEITPYNTVISVMLRGNIVAVRSFLNKKEITPKHQAFVLIQEFQSNKHSKEAAYVQKAVHQTIRGLCHRYNMESSPSINIIDKIDINIEASVVMSDDVQWFNAIAAPLCYIKQKKTVNFCQGEYAKSSFFHKFKDNFVVLSIFAAIAIAAFFINIQYDIVKLKEQVKTFDQAITESFKRTFPDVKTVVEPLMQMQVKLKEAETEIGFSSGKAGGSSYRNIKAVEILYELSNRIPESLDVEITRFLLSEGRVVIAGNTDNFNSVDRIKTMIEKYNRFKSVTISSATADKTGKRVSFNFIIELN